jgi:hypothetical protein
MRGFLGVAILGAGMAMTPAAAFCQTANDSPQAAATTVPAEDQATKEQLTRLFDVMRVKQQVETMKTMMSNMIQQQVKQQTKSLEASHRTPAQKAAAEKLVNKYMDKALNLYPMEEMLDDMATVYQKHISRSDVEAFIAFYGSAPGQHLLDAQPLIAKEFMPVVMKHVQERSKELTDEMIQEANELKAAQSADQTDKPK